MLKFLRAAALAALASACLIASAQAQSARSDVVSGGCGTIAYDAGRSQNDTMDAAGLKCVAALGAQVFASTATITNGTSLTAGIDLGRGRLARIVIPAAWTAANITFKASADGVTYADLYDSTGTEYTVTVGGASRSIIIPLADFIGIRYLQIRSGTTGTPVNQGADRALVLVLVP